MTRTPNIGAPALSPVLLAGLALRPLPPGLLRPVLDLAMAVMRQRHGDVLVRLEPLAGARIVIDPVDLPFRFALCCGGRTTRLLAIGEDDDVGSAAAVVRAPLLVLLGLLEGRMDGDAVFFSRDLVVEGDMEAVLTLRNAIDSGGIDLAEDLLSLFGPLKEPARRALSFTEALFGRAERDLETLRAAFVAPVSGRCEAQAGQLRALEEKLAALRARLPRDKAKAASAGEAGVVRP